jgi:hypothetical protein
MSDTAANDNDNVDEAEEEKEEEEEEEEDEMEDGVVLKVATRSAPFLQTTFNCNICLEFKVLCNLPCGHMICNDCFVAIRSQSAKKNRVICPWCKVSNEVRPIKPLPKNIEVSSFALNFKSIKNTCIGSHCLPQTLHCHDCAVNLCLLCYEEKHVGHQVVYAGDVTPGERNKQGESTSSGCSTSILSSRDISSSSAPRMSDASVSTDVVIEVVENADVEVAIMRDNVSPTAHDDMMWTDHYDQLCRIIQPLEEGGGEAVYCEAIEQKFTEHFYLFNGEQSTLQPWVEEQRNLYKTQQLHVGRLYKLLQLMDRGVWRWTKEATLMNKSGIGSAATAVGDEKEILVCTEDMGTKGKLFGGSNSSSAMKDGDGCVSGISVDNHKSTSSGRTSKRTCSLSRSSMAKRRRLREHSSRNSLVDTDTESDDSRTVPDSDGISSRSLVRKASAGTKLKLKAYYAISSDDSDDYDDDDDNDNEEYKKKITHSNESDEGIVLENSSKTRKDPVKDGKKWQVNTGLLDDFHDPTTSNRLDKIDDVRTSEDQDYFVYGSQQWNMMWYQFLAYGRYHNNCYDVPLEEEGVGTLPPPPSTSSSASPSLSPTKSRPMSLGRWVERLKEKFLRQELCSAAASVVGKLIVEGSLNFAPHSSSVAKEGDSKMNNNIGKKDSTVHVDESSKTADKVVGNGIGAAIDSVSASTTFTSEPATYRVHDIINLTGMATTDNGNCVDNIPVTVQSPAMEAVQGTCVTQHQTSLIPQPKLTPNQHDLPRVPLRGEGVLFRYKSSLDNRYYVGIGVVARVFPVRAAVRVIPFAYYSEKDDQYKPINRHHHGSRGIFHSAIHQGNVAQSVQCLRKKWMIQPRKVMEVATTSVISNQIRFTSRGNKLIILSYALLWLHDIIILFYV